MGTRSFFVAFSQSTQDHPHAYGDKTGAASCLFANGGSSPRVWGQEITYGNDGNDIRIIPTRMGTRKEKQSGGVNEKDHPHAYGDKFM